MRKQIKTACIISLLLLLTACGKEEEDVSLAEMKTESPMVEADIDRVDSETVDLEAKMESIDKARAIEAVNKFFKENGIERTCQTVDIQGIYLTHYLIQANCDKSLKRKLFMDVTTDDEYIVTERNNTTEFQIEVVTESNGDVSPWK